MSLKLYFFRSYSTGLLNVASSAISIMLLIPMIISIVGLEQWGIWATLSIFLGFGTAVELGVGKSLVYYLPKTSSESKRDSIYSASLVINRVALLGIVILFAGLYFSQVIYPLKLGNIPSHLVNWVVLAGISLLALLVMTSPYRGALEGMLKIDLVNIGFLLQTILLYVVLFVIVFLGGMALSMIFSTVFVFIILFLYHRVLVNRKTRLCWQRPTFEDVRNLLRYSSGIYLIGLVNSLVIPINRILVATFSDNITDFAEFDLALRVGLMGLAALAAFTTPLFAVLSDIDGLGPVKSRNLIIRTSILVFCLGVTGNLAFFLLGPWLLGFFLDHKNVLEVHHMAMILLAGLAVYGIAEPFKRALLAWGAVRDVLVINILFLCVNLVSFALIPVVSIELRVAAAYSVSAVLIALISIAWATYKMRVHIPISEFELK